MIRRPSIFISNNENPYAKTQLVRTRNNGSPFLGGEKKAATHSRGEVLWVGVRGGRRGKEAFDLHAE